MSIPPITLNQIRVAAMNMLAMREHYSQELQQKLGRKFAEANAVDIPLPELIQQAITSLQQDNLQSDQRYADAFVYGRIRKQQGELRIKNELKQKGLSSAVIQQALLQCDCDFFQLAKETASKKFGAYPPEDIKAKAKQVRFLQYRGFTHEQIAYALGGE